MITRYELLLQITVDTVIVDLGVRGSNPFGCTNKIKYLA